MIISIIKLIIAIVIGLATVPIVIALFEVDWKDKGVSTIEDEIEYLEAVKKNKMVAAKKNKRDGNKVK